MTFKDLNIPADEIAKVENFAKSQANEMIQVPGIKVVAPDHEETIKGYMLKVALFAVLTVCAECPAKPASNPSQGRHD